MPAYNAAPFIGKSIAAVLNQTLKDFELIVVDDGSTDKTVEAVKTIKDPRIKVFSKKNGGAASARNVGLKKSSGEYVAYCDADDRFAEGHLKILADFLDAHPEVGLAYTKAVAVNTEGKDMGTWGEVFDRNRMQYFCVMVPSITMHRRECLDKAGYWDEDPALKNIHEDWDFFLRVTDDYKVAFLDAPTVLWLKLPEGLFIQSIKNKRYFSGLEYILKKRMKKFLSKKKKGKISPFDGYFFYNFRSCMDAAKEGQRAGAFKSAEVFESNIAPMFEDLSKMDKGNLEIWLVLVLIYFLMKKSDKTVEAAEIAVKLLDQKLDISDRNIVNLVVSSLKGAVYELGQAGEKEAAAKFAAKLKNAT